jgi:hypothetical protein
MDESAERLSDRVEAKIHLVDVKSLVSCLLKKKDLQPRIQVSKFFGWSRCSFSISGQLPCKRKFPVASNPPLKFKPGKHLILLQLADHSIFISFWEVSIWNDLQNDPSKW